MACIRMNSPKNLSGLWKIIPQMYFPVSARVRIQAPHVFVQKLIPQEKFPARVGFVPGAKCHPWRWNGPPRILHIFEGCQHNTSDFHCWCIDRQSDTGKMAKIDGYKPSGCPDWQTGEISAVLCCQFPDLRCVVDGYELRARWSPSRARVRALRGRFRSSSLLATPRRKVSPHTVRCSLGTRIAT